MQKQTKKRSKSDLDSQKKYYEWKVVYKKTKERK